MKKILIRNVDTDMAILAILFAKRLEVEELWVAFGVAGKHLRYFPIHKIAGSPHSNVQGYRSTMHGMR